jgi:hypothetical protein
MTRKQLPPPPGGDDLSAVLRRRHQPAAAPLDGGQADAPASPPPTAPATRAAAEQTPAAPGRRSTTSAAPMDRRSWYMPRSSADALAAAVEDLHWQTRRPKHEVLAAIVAAAVEHTDEARARLVDGR